MKKRLTKGSEDDSKFGGVCSGLGDYFNIDPVFIRIPFALLIFLYAFGLLLYFIFWISLPDHPSN